MARPGSKLALATNLKGHMKEFYGVFEETLAELGDAKALAALAAHVDHRATVEKLAALFERAGFRLGRVVETRASMRFADGGALLRHYFIKLGFLDDWKSVVEIRAARRSVRAPRRESRSVGAAPGRARPHDPSRLRRGRALVNPSSPDALRAVKLVHTAAWAFFAACVFAIPVLAWRGRLGYAAAFIGIVFLEVLVLAFNGWRCPLTRVAARHTEDRRDNFDIYLPEWLARHNKFLFGALYVAGVLFTLARWVRAARP